MTVIAIYAFEGISLFHLSVPNAIFADAFDAQGEISPFKLINFSDNQGSITASNQLKLTIDHDLSVLDKADICIIPSWQPEITPSQQLIEKLQQLNRSGKTIAGLCLGAYVLAYAGLLDDKKATTHWAYSDDFASRFPQVAFDANPLYIHQDNIITSAGTAAAIDSSLYLLKQLVGAKRANQVARLMVAAPERSGGQKQFIQQPIVINSKNQRINHLTQQLLEDLQTPCNLQTAAKRSNMSVRSFSRHFQTHYGKSFIAWLTHARLTFAQQLLESSDLTITQIAEKSGFSSEQNFRKLFKQQFETTPQAWRKLFMT